MKRLGVSLALLATILFAFGAFAGEKGEKGEKHAAKTLRGEIVDMGCYTGHGARGADHKSCALKCIANGMPMGLLTDDDQLYVLIMNHDNADPFEKAKTMAAEMVEITGPVYEKNGTKSLEVTALTKVETAAKK
jgi:hypothetical protein